MVLSEHNTIDLKVGGLVHCVSKIGSKLSCYRELGNLLERLFLIGDNLSSHINVAVLELCQQHNVSFVALPPNSTHLTQPLDVVLLLLVKKILRAKISRS